MRDSIRRYSVFAITISLVIRFYEGGFDSAQSDSQTLLSTQRGDRIHMCSPARGKETGEKRGHGKHYARSDQSERITRTYLIKNLGEHSAGGSRQQQTDEYGERGLQTALLHDQCEIV